MISIKYMFFYHNLIMVKNTKGGKGHKKFGRKFSQPSGSKVLREASDEREIYACVTKVLGNGMAHVLTYNNKIMLLHIRNKFRGRGKRDNTVAIGTYVLVGERDFETIKSDKLQNCDLLEVYNEGEVQRLKKECQHINWNIFKNIVNPISNDIKGSEDVIFEDVDYEQEELIKNEIKATTDTADNKNLLNIGDEDIDWDDI